MSLSALNVKLIVIWACIGGSYVQEYLRIHLFSSVIIARIFFLFSCFLPFEWIAVCHQESCFVDFKNSLLFHYNGLNSNTACLLSSAISSSDELYFIPKTLKTFSLEMFGGRFILKNFHLTPYLCFCNNGKNIELRTFSMYSKEL